MRAPERNALVPPRICAGVGWRLVLWTVAAVGTVAAGFLLRYIVGAEFTPASATAAGMVAHPSVVSVFREIIEAEALPESGTALATDRALELELAFAPVVTEHQIIIEHRVDRSLSADERSRVQKRKLALLAEVIQLVERSDLTSETTQRKH